MTTGKRALIVDDSRSARVILSRMLEQHGMAVDTAESAEQALDYLRQQRPDVIFMDHLMPGMDGFQAVQAIKGDPQTATIPLMMYTSQEGELYVSQARALGAVGVLPKTVRPVDVSRVLYQLRLLPDRRQSRSALFETASRGLALQASAGAEMAAGAGQEPVAQNASTGTTGSWAVPLAELEGGIRESLQQAVRDQFAEQRRFLLATFEAFARRMGGEFREAAEKVPPAPVVEVPTPEPPRMPLWPVALTGLFSLVSAAVLGYLLWQSAERTAGLSRELTASKAELATANEAVASARRAELAALAAVTAAAPSAATRAAQAAEDSKVVEYVPYGEVPLAGARLERLRSLATTLQSHDFRGRIVVETHTGDFCLTGNVSDGYAPADPRLASSDCAVVGNPFDDALSMAQRQSVDFANFVATLRRRSDGAIQVEIVDTGRRSPVPYPKQGESSTAGEWNTVAAQNNRVEFRLVPEG
jgi:CheY-like chemotaxis protein